MAEYKTQSIEQLVDELMSLNDENLARRVQETSDVQWCLGELYDYLHEDVVKVVRCENCKHGPVDDETGRRYCNNPLGTYGCVPVKDDDFCSYGERRCE